MREEGGEAHARCRARRNRLALAAEGRKALFPALFEPAIHQGLVQLVAIGVGCCEAMHHPIPLRLQPLATGYRFAEDSQGLRRDQERFVLGPAEVPLGQADLFLPEGCSVGGGGVLLVRASVGDVCTGTDQRGPVGYLLRTPDGRLYCLDVIACDLLDVPAVRLKPVRHVFGEGQAR